MTTQRRNAILVLAVLAALAAIPLPWITEHKTYTELVGTVTDGRSGKILYQPVRHTYAHVTGLSGFLQFGITVPLWFVPAMTFVSCVGQLLSRFPAFDFPSSAMRFLALSAVLLTILVAILGLAGLLYPTGGYPNVGWFLALFSGIIAFRSDEPSPVPQTGE